MHFTNSDRRYGVCTKTLHWVMFLLILMQFVVATAMLSMDEWETTAGFVQSTLYEWHKSVGIVALVVAIGRYLWRRTASLPDWAPNMTASEKRAIRGVERTLYFCMFLMPASGFVFVMAGDYPIDFFSLGQVPNLIGVHPMLSRMARWTHEVTAGLLVATLFWHWGMAIWHQWRHDDRYLRRMLPFTHQR